MNKELDEMREKIAREICRQSATSLYSRWYENPNNVRENEVWFRRADQILSLETDTCRIAVVKREAELPGDLYNKLLNCPKSIQRAIETPSDLFIRLTGEYEAQQDMLAKHFVEEVVFIPEVKKVSND